MYDEDAILDAVVAVIKEEPGYTNETVTKGDPMVLDKGYAKCAIIDSGRIDNMIEDNETPMYYLHARYAPTLRIFYRYTFDEETRRSLRDETKAMMTRIDSHPTLHGLVERCYCSSANEPAYLRRINGTGPAYMYREISLSITRIETLTMNE